MSLVCLYRCRKNSAGLAGTGNLRRYDSVGEKADKRQQGALGNHADYCEAQCLWQAARQLFTEAEFGKLGKVPMTFIRAPYIDSVGEGVEVLAAVDEHIVAAQYGKQLALAFHPELDLAKSTAIHEYFVSLCSAK